MNFSLKSKKLLFKIVFESVLQAFCNFVKVKTLRQQEICLSFIYLVICIKEGEMEIHDTHVQKN